MIMLAVSLLLLTIVAILSLCMGQYNTPLPAVIKAILNYDPSIEQELIVRTSRLSRTVIALIVGGSLSISGALMQGLTRNNLASPSLFGINAGALFSVVIATKVLILPLSQLIFVAFIGGILAISLVFLMVSRGQNKLSPLKMVLSGAAVSALFISFTQGFLVLDEQTLDSVLFWLGGSVSGRSLDVVKPVLPFMISASLLSLFLAKPINILLNGEDIAKGLGMNVLLVKLLLGVTIVFLAGGSVAIAGSISFVGLIIPHVVKNYYGNNYFWIIPLSFLWGGTLLLFADIISRLIVIPEEMPIGVITAVVGAPLFISIIRKGGKIVS